VIASTVAGGLLLGGYLVALGTLARELAVTGAPAVTLIAFVGGSLLGLVHGAVLGVIGRPDGMSRQDAVADVLTGALWVVPIALASLVVTLWLSITRWAFVVRQPFLIAGVILSWLVGLAALVWFARELWGTARTAVRRWPERRRGAALIGATFIALLAILVATRPEIWWTDERVSIAGAAVLAFGITVWAALPLEVLALHLMRRRQA
jgi:hypothetical protein